MHIAVAKLDVKTVVKLIMRKADPDAQDLKNGDRPLHTLMNVYQKNQVAAKKILGFLVEAGANINSKNNELWNPLHIAVKKGHMDAVESFLAYKYKGLVDLDSPGGILDSSPLHVAA
jgi:ankyrin repeat protein